VLLALWLLLAASSAAWFVLGNVWLFSGRPAECGGGGLGLGDAGPGAALGVLAVNLKPETLNRED